MKNIDESYSYLQNDFSSVARILSEYNPLDLMKISLWNEREVTREKVKDAVKREAASLLPVLLQSVLSSTHFISGGVERVVSTRDWTRLKSLAEDVVRRLVRLIENRTALAASEEGLSDRDAENYRNIIASYLLVEEVTALSLSKDSSLLRSLFEEKVELEEKTGVDYITLSLNIDNIAKKGLGGIDDLSARVQAYSSDYELAAAKMKSETEGKSDEEAYRIITAANGWEGRAENLIAERDGFDMFRLSSLSSLDGSAWNVFTVSPGSLDLISFMKMGYWPSLRFPFVTWKGDTYTFVGKHIPRFIALTSSFSRRRATLHDVLAIFYRIGVDTYTYDGNSVDISVLGSYYDKNLFTDAKAYSVIRKLRDDEWALKPGYGHRRLIVDPDEREDMREENGALVISSAFMAEAAVDRTKKRDLLRALLGNLDLPEEKSEYNIVDEDELERSDSCADDVADDTATDEFEYDPTDEDEEARKLDERDERVELVEYEKKDSVDISEAEKKYALTDEIIRKEEEIEKEEEAYESELDDDIFDDTEEEERLDEIGGKEESDYYEEIEEEPPKEEPCPGDDREADNEDEGQLDFFSLLDEDEEKAFDDELEKEDEEEFRADEEKAEENEVEEPTLEDEIADKIEEELSEENSETLDETSGISGDPDADNESAYALFSEDEESSESSETAENDVSEPSGYSEEFETETEDEAEPEDEDFSSSVSEYDGTSLIDDDTEEGDSFDAADAETALSDEEEEIETADDDYSADEEEKNSDETDEENEAEDETPASDDSEASLSEEEEIDISDDDYSGEHETPEEEGTEEEKPLDVNAWMNDFLGLNDIKEDSDAEEEIDVGDEDETESESDVKNDADESDEKDIDIDDEPEAEESEAEDSSIEDEAEVDDDAETEEVEVSDNFEREEDAIAALESDSEEEVDVKDEDEIEYFEEATESDDEVESVEDSDVDDDSETEEVDVEDDLLTEEDALAALESDSEEDVDVGDEDETEDAIAALESDSEEEIDVEDENETEDFEEATASDDEVESAGDTDVDDDPVTEEVNVEDETEDAIAALESDSEEEIDVEDENETEDFEEATASDDEVESAGDTDVDDDPVTEEVNVEDETEDAIAALESDSEEEVDVKDEDETEEFEEATESDDEVESVEDTDVDDSETEEVDVKDEDESDSETVTEDSDIVDSAVEENNADDEPCDGREASDGETEDESGEEEKPLDVNSWMSDFLGLGDVSGEESEDEASSDEANLNDDGFVLPRMGMIEEEKKVTGVDASPLKEEEAEEQAEESAVSVTLDDEAVPTPVRDIKDVDPGLFSTSSDRESPSVGLEEGEIPQCQAQVLDEEEMREKQVLSMEDLDGADEPIPLMTAEETGEDDVIQFSGIVSDIYKKLLGSGGVFRSFVKGADSETLEELENIIQSCWNRMQSEQKDKLFNVPDFSFSILLSHDSKRDDLRMAELLNNVGGVMYSRGKEEWTAVILYINSSYNLETAMEKTLTKESFSPSDWKRVTYIGEQMKKR